ncbi:hypothetical protein MATL_G00252300 [Megalops atlanticus]|uniref:Uncharacterized protein n=1 Tax=Megalops atlanticus TaxID=7932 RepID=A0A9D3SUC8_MEGAT|nr:hypothetical protein MATL_G00252300 [Megalops atlanticus]
MGNVHAANATGETLQIFYSSNRISPQDLTVKLAGEAGTTGVVPAAKASAGVDVGFKWKESVGSQVIPLNQFINCNPTGDLHISVFYINSDMEPTKKIMENVKFPANKSVIFTKGGGYKYAKKGEIWIDEEGQDHRPKLMCERGVCTTFVSYDKGVQADFLKSR